MDMSINTKDLRDILDEAMRKAGAAIAEAKIPDKIPDISDIGRRDTTPGLVYFSIGLVFGALVGVVIAFLATPYNGREARQKLQERVEQARRQREEYPIDPLATPTNGSIPA